MCTDPEQSAQRARRKLHGFFRNRGGGRNHQEHGHALKQSKPASRMQAPPPPAFVSVRETDVPAYSSKFSEEEVASGVTEVMHVAVEDAEISGEVASLFVEDDGLAEFRDGLPIGFHLEGNNGVIERHVLHRRGQRQLDMREVDAVDQLAAA